MGGMKIKNTSLKSVRPSGNEKHRGQFFDRHLRIICIQVLILTDTIEGVKGTTLAKPLHFSVLLHHPSHKLMLLIY
eukprot:c12112_g1_i1 orf=140-367(+)